MQMYPAEWRRAMGMAHDEIPAAVVMEGSWWRKRCEHLRLPKLDQVRELAFPDMHLGWVGGTPIAYAWAYGASRAVEPVHAFGMAGTPMAIQIGSCGALQPGVATGDIVLAEPALIGEGASQYYGGSSRAEGSTELIDRAEIAFRDRGYAVHRGPHLTTSALFAQPPERVQQWRAAGYLAVDMETSAVFTAARQFGMKAVSLLFVWDELLAGRSFLSAYTGEEQERQQRANADLMEVAIELAVSTPKREMSPRPSSVAMPDS